MGKRATTLIWKTKHEKRVLPDLDLNFCFFAKQPTHILNYLTDIQTSIDMHKSNHHFFTYNQYTYSFHLFWSSSSPLCGRVWTASKVGSRLVFSHFLVYLDSQDCLAHGCDLTYDAYILHRLKSGTLSTSLKVRENTGFSRPTAFGKALAMKTGYVLFFFCDRWRVWLKIYDRMVL